MHEHHGPNQNNLTGGKPAEHFPPDVDGAIRPNTFVNLPSNVTPSGIENRGGGSSKRYDGISPIAQERCNLIRDQIDQGIVTEAMMDRYLDDINEAITLIDTDRKAREKIINTQSEYLKNLRKQLNSLLVSNPDIGPTILAIQSEIDSLTKLLFDRDLNPTAEQVDAISQRIDVKANELLVAELRLSKKTSAVSDLQKLMATISSGLGLASIKQADLLTQKASLKDELIWASELVDEKFGNIPRRTATNAQARIKQITNRLKGL